MVRIKYLAVFVALAIASTATLSADVADAGNACCVPPPIHTTICVQPPCSCCAKNVSVCVPACCTEAPRVSWRKGFLGRCVGTYCWPCCGHTVEVVVTRRGAVRVRG